jgi:preprotein translocase subunit SecY
MKKFFSTIQNIWKIDELRNRILFTLGLLFIYRVGSFIVLPGVIPSVLKQTASEGNGLLGLINIFTGGAFNQGAIFALGIMPYITASIIIQLLGFAVPYFKKLQSKEGESGRKRLTQITRLLTIAITLVQGGAYLTYLTSQGAIDPHVGSGLFYFAGLIILSAGTIFAMWLGEKITDRGIGNGVSLLITVGIIASLPLAFTAEFTKRASEGGFFIFAIELAALFAVVMVTVLIVQGIRKIPVQYVQRMVGRGSADINPSAASDSIPIKVIAAGVMPIIFAQALMFLPSTLAQGLGGEGGVLQGAEWLNSITDPTSFWYNFIQFLLVVIFTYVYTALIVDPQQYSEYLKSRNGFIPGVKPGKPTADFIDTVTTRITLPGSIALGLIAILPGIASSLLGIDFGFALFFGGTSLLIMVAVVLDTLQQIESYLLMRRYDGLVKSGRVQGKQSTMQQIGSTI